MIVDWLTCSSHQIAYPSIYESSGLPNYRGASGTRAVENLRLIVGELQIADVKAQVCISLFTDS